MPRATSSMPNPRDADRPRDAARDRSGLPADKERGRLPCGAAPLDISNDGEELFRGDRVEHACLPEVGV